MKKVSLIGFLSISLLVFGACGNGEGDSKKSNIDASVEKVSTEKSEDLIEDSSEAEVTNDKVDYNQEITDDENVKISLMNIEHIVDKEYDEERYIISFDVTNKRDKTMTVQAREVSIDDRMVDESLLMMSTDISSGKTANAKLVIESYSDEKLPEMVGNLELILHAFNSDYDSDDEFRHEVPVKITLK